MRYLKYILAQGAVLSCAVVSAQNFNESVEVTNDLIVDLSGSQRKTVEMAVPDSISKFNLNFDYSVFAKPYKGAYEFTPYNVLFRPVSAQEKSPLFYLDAGAGFTFSPQFQAIVSPRLGKKFYMDIYQDFDGYVGPYSGKDGKYRGYDLDEVFGVHGRAFLKPFDLSFNTFYEGIWAKDFALNGQGFHSVTAQLYLTSERAGAKYLDWNLGLDYHFARENAAVSALDENTFHFKGALSPVALKAKFPQWRAVVNYDGGFSAVRGAFSDDLLYIGFNPRAEYAGEKFSSTLGFKMGTCDGFYIFPDVEFSYKLFKSSLQLYLGVSGENTEHTYYGYKTGSHHFSGEYFRSDGNVLSATKEWMNAYVGFRGVLSSYLEYSLKGGYAIRRNASLYSLAEASSMQAIVSKVDYNCFYLTPSLHWNSRSFEINADAFYQGVKTKDETDAFLPSAFRAYGDFTYKSMGRIFVGFSLNYMGERASGVYGSLPSYLDLGLHADCRLTPELTLWLRADNLLNQKIEDVPFTAHLWPSVTAGLRLVLR